jgi:ankyrin repeat protein
LTIVSAFFLFTEFADQLVATKEPDLVRALARKHDSKNDTPMQLAAHFGRVEILDKMLQFDLSLGYHGREAVPLLFTAASRGHVEFARKLVESCPDAPYVDVHARTCLHEAVLKNRMKFVEFILKESKLSKLINMQDNDGNTALHLAVQECNTKMVGALLRHPHIDISVVNNGNCAPIWKLNELDNYVKTINWVHIHALLRPCYSTFF